VAELSTGSADLRTGDILNVADFSTVYRLFYST